MGPRRWSRKVWAIVGLVVVGVVAVFAVVAVRYNDTVLDANACPQPTAVNAVLRTTLDTVSGVQLSDLHSCQYAEGADPQALWIDAAVPTGHVECLRTVSSSSAAHGGGRPRMLGGGEPGHDPGPTFAVRRDPPRRLAIHDQPDVGHDGAARDPGPDAAGSEATAVLLTPLFS